MNLVRTYNAVYAITVEDANIEESMNMYKDK